jgi:hypothetical protein
MSVDTCPPSALPVLHKARHKPGRGNDVSSAEAKEIQLAALLEGLTMQALAERFGRTRRTVSRVLKRPSFEKMRSELDAEMVTEARQVLASHRTVAAAALGLGHWLLPLSEAITGPPAISCSIPT